MLRLSLFPIALLFFPLTSFSQTQSSGQAVRVDPAAKIWLLSGAKTSYALGVGPEGQLVNLFWGGRLWRMDDIKTPPTRRDISSFDPSEMLYREEFPGWGGKRFYEPAVKITEANGNRDLVLKYKSYEIKDDQLNIRLQDIRDKVQVELHYHMDLATRILGRSATIQNRTGQVVTVESAQSAVWNLPPGEGYRLSYLSGRWAAETQLNREPIHEGIKLLESRLGHTGHNLNPWFAIDRGTAKEESGRVWFGALAWSGNWKIAVEQTPYRQVRVTGGMNSFDFSYPLKPGEDLATPVFYAGFTDSGFGEASRLLHDFERSKLQPNGEEARLRPVLYNSWEATTFDVNEPGQIQLADKAAKLGVELFVVDDGWFGKRNNDHAGLGDWVVNKNKFPNGLKSLIEHVNSLGMDFGLWVEPEMVNPDSDLYRAHPDWVMHFPNRPRSELRNQLVLNLARDDVRDYLFQALDRLLNENKIRYFKWDMNRIFSEPGWPEQSPAEQREIWVKYVTNLYSIFDRLRAKHPDLEIESCSGGGGRVDLGILPRVEEFWTSDNTEAFDRLKIQDGFSQAYAPRFMSAWVTDVPNMNGRSTPLQYRFLVAMQGALGIGSNLNKMSDADAQLATKMVALDKRIRKTVQTGGLYRLMPPRGNDTVANQYVSKDKSKAVLFAFRHSQQFKTDPPIIYLQGLDPKAVYRLEPFDKQAMIPETASGAFLMEQGLQLSLTGDYASTMVMLQRQ